MIISIPNYQILSIVYNGTKTIIYRAYKHPENIPVILKTIKSENPTEAEQARLKHEYDILKNLDDIEGVVKVYKWEVYYNKPVLVLEDVGGESLEQAISCGQINLKNFLPLALRITQILGAIHQNQIVHQNIKPKNILINWQTNKVKIIDFSLASYFFQKHPLNSYLDLASGTSAYLSPEQAGPIKGLIDYRTDFYSLGVTFYQMLTGKVPHIEGDRQGHLWPPVPERERWLLETSQKRQKHHQGIDHHLIKPEIPPILVSIITKLLAQSPQERYQNALNLEVDLENCLKQLVKSGTI